MIKSAYHVIIIGAGPSGLATAISLQEQGIKDVLVIEKGVFPRYKCCAGYITSKTKKIYEKFGLNIKNCHYSLIKDFNIIYKHDLKQSIKNEFLYTNKNINRIELDNAFFQLAKSKNIDIIENITIKEHNILNNKVILSNKNIIAYNYLVFADGTMGYGSKYQKFKKKNIAMQATFKSVIKDSIDIHFGITKKGYAWVSSYNNTTNVGLTDVYNSKVNYQEAFQNFLKELNLKCSPKNIKGAFTPIMTRKPIINKNIFYVGDAVGACDPFTLSGLRYSLQTGSKCALAITKNKPSIYTKYIKVLNVRFRIMSFIQNIFYLKIVLFLVFNIGCRFFKYIISYAFNHFFINKK